MFLNRKHLFHMVDPSPLPFYTGIAAFFFTSGLAFYIHRIEFGFYFFLFGFVVLLFIASDWFSDICNEASFLGYHTMVVRKGLKLGFLLFIVSEIMLFFGFFWAFFHSALCPSIELGTKWPPIGINTISVIDYPLFNTLLLIISGFSVTWVHKGICLGTFSETIDAFIVTITLGALFICLQTYEYYEANFNISDSVYASTFFMLTGLHGMHVIVGVVFLSVSFLRLLSNHFMVNHHLGLVFAIWYWHFVDIVWICLFLMLYIWGSW